MRILSRTLVASYLVLFVAILSASLLAISVIEVMLHFDDISLRGGGLRGVLHWLGVRVPSYYLRDLLAVTSCAAACFCLGVPARRLEVAAAMAGGIPPLRLGLPVLGAAALLSGAALAADETLVLRASRAWHAVEAAGDVLSHRGPFWYHRDGRIYNVGPREAPGDTLREVEIYQLGPRGRLLARLRAERARLDGEHRWHLGSARRVRFDPERPAAAPQLESLAGLVVEPDVGAGPADPAALTLPALRRAIARLEAAGAPATRERALFHARLADPLCVFVFALLGVSLGLSVWRSRSLSSCAVRGGLALGAFFGARALGSLLVLAGFGSAVYAPWLLLLAAAAWGAGQLLRTLRA